MKKPRNLSPQDQAFLHQVDALIGTPDEFASDAASELELCGINPDELRQSAFQQIRKIATERYSSLGKDIPQRMSEALKQLKPASPEEQNATLSKRANTRLQDFLVCLRDAGNSSSAPATFAPAYRNKENTTSREDEEILREQQEHLDAEDEK